MTLVAPPQGGGCCAARVFIPHRAHASIGVLGAVTTATACLVEGSVAADVADVPTGTRKTLAIEHASGETSCVMEVDDAGEVVSSALLRTARKLMDGHVFA
jgi:4-oxalomesaconate tautomerase